MKTLGILLLCLGLFAFADVQREHKLTGIVVTHLDTLGTRFHHRIDELERNEWKDSIAKVEFCVMGEPVEVKGDIMLFPSRGDVSLIPFATSAELTQQIRRFSSTSMPGYRGRIKVLRIKDSTDKEYPDVIIDLQKK